MASTTAEILVDLETPQSVKVSPSGQQVVYSVVPATTKGLYSVSSIWIAQVDTSFSAKQITSGLFNDTQPQWSPDETCIAFISDRADRGKSSAVYLLPIGCGEPYPVTDVKAQQSITKFEWSPDSKLIAFSSPDEISPKQSASKERREDVKVYGTNLEFNRLRITNVSTKKQLVVFEEELHVHDYSWSLDGTQIAVVLNDTPQLPSTCYKGVRVQIITVASRLCHAVCDFPGPIHDICWTTNDQLAFLAGASPDKMHTSKALYLSSISSREWSQVPFQSDRCITSVCWSSKHAVLKVEKGLFDQVVLDGTILYEEECAIDSWDVRINDSESVLVFTKSSCQIPTEIFSVYRNRLIQLSQHSTHIQKTFTSISKSFYWTSSEGTSLSGILILPGCSSTSPYPTVIIPHGGPNTRNTHSFNNPYYHLSAYLTSHPLAFAVLCPNYHGSSSYGESFVASARANMGTTDYDDVISMVEAGISRGIVDPSRIMIAGWSQGGFLAALSVTRYGCEQKSFEFRGAVVGAGPTNWEELCATSDAALYEKELYGSAPWDVVGVEDSSEAKEKANALKSLARNGQLVRGKMRVLLLHGEEDIRVPVSQAYSFRRGCEHWGIECIMAVYPREMHRIMERWHRLDMLKRIGEFCINTLS